MTKQSGNVGGIIFGPKWKKEWNRFLTFKRVIKGAGRMEKHCETVVRMMDEITDLRKEVKELKERLGE